MKKKPTGVHEVREMKSLLRTSSQLMDLVRRKLDVLENIVASVFADKEKPPEGAS